MTFKVQPPLDGYLHMTMGLTQPVAEGEKAYPWEFSVRTAGNQEWASDLLYQMLTQWHWKKGGIWFGSLLPLVFFTDRGGKLWSGMTDDASGLNVVGSIRGLYLWTDERCLRFSVSTGAFSLLSIVGVTEEEVRLANETTPAHLMLLLRRIGVTQVCDPHRRSVLSLPGATEEWDRIKGMLHDDALDELQREA